jgi:hypothetical protein
MLFIGLSCRVCYSTPPFNLNLVGKLDASCGEKGDVYVVAMVFNWAAIALTTSPIAPCSNESCGVLFFEMTPNAFEDVNVEMV